MDQSYQATIGLEIHAELKTQTKMFCHCVNNPFESAPNANVCPVCLGLPGALPVINIKGIKSAILLGKALKSKIASQTSFDRKHYFYPDLPKGYQISQYHQPIATGGKVDTALGAVRVNHIHLEEDTGKLTHPKGENYSLIDYNRSGVPLIELVTEPDIHSGAQAKDFCQKLQTILRYLDVSDADMEKGQMRCEVNISINQKLKNKNQKLGTKVEIKNINSFKAVEKAIDSEIVRQSALVSQNQPIIQETRGWDADSSATVSQRIKETSADYRYFPEPDLPPLELTEIEKKLYLPALPQEINEELLSLGLDNDTAEFLIANKSALQFFNTIRVRTKLDIPQLAQIIKNIAGKTVFANIDAPLVLAELFDLIFRQEISKELALKKVYPLLLEKNFSVPVETIMRQLNIGAIDSIAELGAKISQIIHNSPQEWERLKAGETKLISFFIGGVMKATAGQADPILTSRLLRDMIKNGGKNG